MGHRDMHSSATHHQAKPRNDVKDGTRTGYGRDTTRLKYKRAAAQHKLDRKRDQAALGIEPRPFIKPGPLGADDERPAARPNRRGADGNAPWTRFAGTTSS